MILLYCAQGEVNEAAGYVEWLHQFGKPAAVRSVRFYTGEIEVAVNKSKVCKVLFTPLAEVVDGPYTEAGIATECVTDLSVPGPPPEPVEIPESVEPVLPPIPAGYQVLHDHAWWKAFGPHGLKVGKARRSEAEAIDEAWAHYHDPDPWHTAKQERELQQIE